MLPNLKAIDAHCHINFNAYKDDAPEVIARAEALGVGMIAVGSQYTTSARAVDYAEAHEHIWAAVGLHPSHIFPDHVDVDEVDVHYETKPEAFDADAYTELAKRSKKVMAIGECGLDYYRVPNGISRDELVARQKDAFAAQIDLAHRLDLPVMIHCRDAHDDCAAILESRAEQGRPSRGNIHCFTGTWPEAERYLRLGFYISFTGIITFPPKASLRPQWEALQEAARNVPMDRILIETDAPYLAPAQHRGKRNEPAFVLDVAKYLAEVRKLELEEVLETVFANTKRNFGLE